MRYFAKRQGSHAMALSWWDNTEVVSRCLTQLPCWVSVSQLVSHSVSQFRIRQKNITGIAIYV